MEKYKSPNTEWYQLPGEYSDFCIAFDRTEALPPDEVTVGLGLSSIITLKATELAKQVYECGETGIINRVLDLGCGVGSFMVGAIAASDGLPIEVVGLDRNEGLVECARRNVESAQATSIAKNPRQFLSSRFYAADWLDPNFWQACGKFDYIYFNPPYLRPGQDIRQPGYETVPADQLYAEDPSLVYSQILGPCLEHLNPLGTIIMRASSRSALNLRITYPDIDLDCKLTRNGGWRPVTQNRSAYVERFTLLPSDSPENRLPPYSNPRIRVLLSTGQDIGEV